jgi:hypothetical protein
MHENLALFLALVYTFTWMTFMFAASAYVHKKEAIAFLVVTGALICTPFVNDARVDAPVIFFTLWNAAAVYRIMERH